MGVIVLPIEMLKASAIKNTTGLIPSSFEIYIAIGTPSIAMVSFTKNADSSPIPKTNNINSISGLFAFDNIFSETSASTPDLSRALTMLNIPKRNNMISRFTDLNADSMLILGS